MDGCSHSFFCYLLCCLSFVISAPTCFGSACFVLSCLFVCRFVSFFPLHGRSVRAAIVSDVQILASHPEKLADPGVLDCWSCVSCRSLTRWVADSPILFFLTNSFTRSFAYGVVNSDMHFLTDSVIMRPACLRTHAQHTANILYLRSLSHFLLFLFLFFSLHR